MTALVLCKQTGVPVGRDGHGLCADDAGKGRSAQPGRWVAACAVPLVMLGLWEGYCLLQGLGSIHIDRLTSASSAWPEVRWAWEWIVKTLLIRPFNRSGGWDGMLPAAGLPAVAWVGLFARPWCAEPPERCAPGVSPLPWSPSDCMRCFCWRASRRCSHRKFRAGRLVRNA